MNSALTDLSLTFSKPPSLTIIQGDSLVLSLAAGDFSFEEVEKCTINGKIVPCDFDASKLVISNITDSSSFKLLVSGLRNSKSLKPPVALNFALVN